MSITKLYKKYNMNLKKILKKMQFDFLIVGSAKCGTTGIHRCLRSHPDIYMPSLESGINGETGFFLSDLKDTVKGLTSQKISTNIGKITKNYNGEKIIGERSTDYTKKPYRSVEIEKIKEETKIIFSYRNPIERIRKMYNHHLKNEPRYTKDNFEKENTEYYIKTSMLYYQMKPYFEKFDEICVVNIESENERISKGNAKFIGVEPEKISLSYENVNKSFNSDIKIPDSKKKALLEDFKKFKNYIERSRVTHVSKQK